MEIRLLGGFGLLVDGQPVPIGSWRLRKAKDVVKILALARGHRRHRDEVIEALWPERDAESGLNNLHQALHIARRGLAGPAGQGPARCRAQSAAGARGMGGAVPRRAHPGRRRGVRGRGGPRRRRQDPAPIEAALRLYHGDLLPEDRYEDWALGSP